MGKEFEVIRTPCTNAQVEWLLNFSDSFALAFVSFKGQVLYHLPKNPLLHFLNLQQVIFPSAFSMEPLDRGKIFFTHGSPNRKAVIVSETDTRTFKTSFTSAQKTELYAVIQVFSHYPSIPFNLYTDFQYVYRLFPVIEIVLINANEATIDSLLQKLQQLCQRSSPYLWGTLGLTLVFLDL